MSGVQIFMLTKHYSSFYFVLFRSIFSRDAFHMIFSFNFSRGDIFLSFSRRHKTQKQDKTNLVLSAVLVLVREKSGISSLLSTALTLLEFVLKASSASTAPSLSEMWWDL